MLFKHFIQDPLKQIQILKQTFRERNQVYKIGTMYEFLYSLSYVDIKSFLKEVRSDVLMFLKLYFLLSFSSYLY